MSRKALKSDAPMTEENTEKVLNSIGDLLETHTAEINEAIEDSDDRKITINFTMEIDASKSAPAIDIKCRFTPRTITDRRSIECDEPGQFGLNVFTPEELQKKAKSVERAEARAAKAAQVASDRATQAAQRTMVAEHE